MSWWRVCLTNCTGSLLCSWTVAALATPAILLMGACQGSSNETEIVFEAEALVDLGPDLGQNFGSLFEVKDKDGRVIIGAGFPGVYNSRHRNNRYSLQFYVRPQASQEQVTIESTGKPDDEMSGTWLFDLDGQVYSGSGTRGRPYARWNPAAQIWETDNFIDPEKQYFGDGATRVGDDLLVYSQSTATYKGRQILAPPEEGNYYSFYYGSGHLIFYCTRPGTEPEGRTTLYACPWTPDQEEPIDLAEAKSLSLKYSGEIPFAFGQLRNETVTCSNLGGFYAFDGIAWKVIRPSLRGVSYQIYTMVNYYDRLLMGQYPTGNLIEYDGYQLTHLANEPPVMEGVSTAAREAQSSMIYGGELYIGVWPWGEVWRYDLDNSEWRFVQRLFTDPPLTDQYVHPYEEDLIAYNKAAGEELVVNTWGQRVTAMAPTGTDLLLSTSTKSPFVRDERLTFVTDEVFEAFGQVYRLNLPGNLSVSINPTAGPTKLRLVVLSNRMEIHQDGQLIAEAPISAQLLKNLHPDTISWRYGVFGPFRGSLTGRSVQPKVEAIRPSRDG
jgi:hypothetical protein